MSEITVGNALVRGWLEELAEYFESESDYFEREGEADTAEEWAAKAQSVRSYLAGPMHEQYQYPAPCPTCHGTGGGQYNDCPTCGGNGVV